MDITIKHDTLTYQINKLLHSKVSVSKHQHNNIDQQCSGCDGFIMASKTYNIIKVKMNPQDH